jgi:hypothetical protein
MRVLDRRRGFTLVEVMLALAILFGGLVVLIRSTAGNIRTAQHAHYMGVATNLVRGKMYDLEAELLEEGFQELDQEFDGDFSEEGWPNIEWEAVVEKVELPASGALDALARGEGDEEAATEEGGGFGLLGTLGGMGGMGGMGGGGLGDATDGRSAAEGSFIASQFEMLSQILEASIRKVTLTVRFKVAGQEWSFDTILYLTEPAAIQKVIMGGFGGGGGEDDGSDQEDTGDDRNDNRRTGR